MFKRLRWRLTATYIGLVVLSMLVLGFCLLNFLEDYFYEGLKERLRVQALLAGKLALLTARDGWDDVGVMEDLADEIARDVGARVTIIDADGRVLGDSVEDALEMDNHLNRPEVRDAARQGVGVAVRHSKTLDTDMMYVAVTVSHGGIRYGYMRLAMPTTETRQAFFKLWSMLVLAFLTVVLAMVPVGFGLGKKVTAPVERLIEFAREMSRGNFNCRAEVDGSDEIRELAATLNHMADTIEEKVRLISEGKSRLEAVLASMTSGVIFVDREGYVDLANPAAEKFLSLTLGMSGNGDRRLLYSAVIKHPDLSDAIGDVLEGGRLVEREIRITCPREVVLRAVISPIRDLEGELSGAVAVLHDITEMRRLERMRRDLIANVSHELKTPVTAVKGFTETLLDGALYDPETCREFVEIIDCEAERLRKLIQDLLELSRIEAGQVKLNRMPVDVSLIVRDAVSRLQGRVRVSGLEVELFLPGRPVVIEVDRDMIEQALVNLVDNAIKFTPAGGKIRVEVIEGEDDVTVSVHDTGIGIPASDLDRVFERFYRVDKDRSRARGGTGLGLSIVKHIIEIHGGEVGVHSKPGKGSIFFFRLPRK